MEYKKVKPKDLKKHGKMVNGVLYLKEGIYCINTPVIDVGVAAKSNTPQAGIPPTVLSIWLVVPIVSLDMALVELA